MKTKNLEEEKLEVNFLTNSLFKQNPDYIKEYFLKEKEDTFKEKYNLEATKAILKKEEQEMESLFKNVLKSSAKKLKT